LTASSACVHADRLSTLAAQPADAVHALLRRALGGSRGDQEQLTRRVLVPVADAATSKYLFGRARRHFEKEDVVQGVIIHLVEDDWRKLRSFDPAAGSLVSFLMTVVKNWIRDNSRRIPPPEPIEDPEQDLAPSSGPENKAYQRQIWSMVLERLDEHELLLFRWVHVEGLARAEIAERLQISLEAAYKQIQRMEEKVKSTLSRPEGSQRSARGMAP
jgi:RNA polymerase sigma-70 factor (ECF subfamily)